MAFAVVVLEPVLLRLVAGALLVGAVDHIWKSPGS